MNRYISKSYTTSKNTIDRQYKLICRAGAAVVSTITSVFINKTIKFTILYAPQKATLNYITKRKEKKHNNIQKKHTTHVKRLHGAFH